MNNISEKTISRLSLYRRVLNELAGKQTQYVYLHELANLSGIPETRVRSDLMFVGFSGSPTKVYNTRAILTSISNLMDAPGGQPVALMGIGNLGRAILTYFAGRRPNLSIVAAFDTDQSRIGKILNGCRCYHIDDLKNVIEQNNIRMAIIAVPAEIAQSVADQLINYGVCGLLNFAPVLLQVPSNVYVEDIDVTLSIEKASYFTRKVSEREIAGKKEVGLKRTRNKPRIQSFMFQS